MSIILSIVAWLCILSESGLLSDLLQDKQLFSIDTNPSSDYLIYLFSQHSILCSILLSYLCCFPCTFICELSSCSIPDNINSFCHTDVLPCSFSCATYVHIPPSLSSLLYHLGLTSPDTPVSTTLFRASFCIIFYVCAIGALLLCISIVELFCTAPISYNQIQAVLMYGCPVYVCVYVYFRSPLYFQ